MVVPEPFIFPRVDDHLVHLETRDELVCGHMMLEPPAQPTHAELHADIGALTNCSVALGHADPDFDVGTDACIRYEDIHPVPEPTAVEAKARDAGMAQGLAKGIVAVCEVLEIPLDADRLSHIETLDLAGREALLTKISAERRWP